MVQHWNITTRKSI